MSQLIGTASNQVPTNGDLGSAAFLDSSAFYGTGSNPVFRNRWINGKMEIAQRTTSAITMNNGGGYPVDRFQGYAQSTGRYTVQQSTDVPTGQGFQNSVVCTVTVTTNTATDTNATHFLGQYIEGYNVADLMWGTANAKPITVSFWVKSSVAGTYALTSTSGTGTNRGIVKHYTVNNANTWEYKTVTIPGSTSGGDTDWSKTNGRGLGIWWGLGSYSTWQGALDVWGTYSNGVFGSSTAVPWISNSGATFYITGIQVEAGMLATPFEHRPITIEDILCKRYCEVVRKGANETLIGIAYCYNSNYNMINYQHKVTKRIEPTVTLTGSSTDVQMLTTGGSWNGATSVSFTPNINSTRIIGINTGFTVGNATEMRIEGTSYITISAEL